MTATPTPPTDNDALAAIKAAAERALAKEQELKDRQRALNDDERKLLIGTRVLLGKVQDERTDVTDKLTQLSARITPPTQPATATAIPPATPAPTAVATPVATAPPVAPPAPPAATTRNIPLVQHVRHSVTSRSSRSNAEIVGMGLIVGVFTAIVVALVWSLSASIAGGNNGWVHNGWLEALAAIVFGLGVALLVMSRGLDDEQHVEEETVETTRSEPLVNA